MSLLTDEIRAMIGTEAVYTAPEPLGRAAIRYFALAVGDDNPLYTDDDFATRQGYPGVIAPPTLVCETAQYMPGEQDDDGYIGHLWHLPVEGCRIIRGGNDYTFHRPVLPGDVITARWRIDDITERTSRDGARMLVVESVARYENQDGEPLAENRETIIYQEIAR